MIVRTHRQRLVLLLAAGLALTVAACGGSSQSEVTNPPDPAGTTAPTAAPTEPPKPIPEPPTTAPAPPPPT